MRQIVAATFLCLVSTSGILQGQARRAVRATDIYRLRDVGDSRISPDGEWIAYTVTTVDSTKYKSDSDLWMVKWDGSRTLRLTSSPENEGSPRWSPDNRYLSFVSERYESKSGQVWLLDRAGGEAVRLTELKGGVADHEWSPDGTRIAIISHDPDPEDAKPDSLKSKNPKPIVIDRYHFKEDREGYLDRRRDHLYVIDVTSKKVEQVTTGDSDESAPCWSPDGKRIAFVSRRGPDPDRENNSDIFVVDARAGAEPLRLTSWLGPDDSPVWSPDGALIAYLQGSEPQLSAYNQDQLAVVASTGGTPRLLTTSLDRDVSNPTWTRDGKSITVLVPDDRAVYVASMALADGRITKVLEGRRVVAGIDVAPNGRTIARAATSLHSPEVFALEGGTLRALTHVNDSLFAALQLGTTEDLSFKDKDGFTVGALLVKPAGFAPNVKYPLVLRIHGGPNGQDAHQFSLERELLAAQGYLVLAVNYRGSSGRGQAWKRAIFAAVS